MAEIPVQARSARKVALNLTQAAAGDTAQVGANKDLVVRNADAVVHTVTIGVPGSGFTGTATPDLVETIAAGEIAIIPLLDVYADPANNYRAVVTYDAMPVTLTRVVVARL